MHGNFPQNSLEAYGATSAALARGEERLAMSANRPALLARIRMLETEALGSLEGETVRDDQLALDHGHSQSAWRRWPHAFAQVFARPLPARGLPNAEVVHRWLHEASAETDPAPTRPPIVIYEDRLKAWERHCSAAQAQAPLLAAADLAAAFARFAPLSRGNAVIGVMLGESCVKPVRRYSSGGIAAIGLSQRQLPWLGLLAERDDGEADDISAPGLTARRRHAWLEALAAGGIAVVELARRVDQWTQVVETACATKRSSSRLRRVAELAAEAPSLTATRLAGLLGISRQGATLLLNEARDRQIVREVTQGNAFRRYAAAI